MKYLILGAVALSALGAPAFATAVDNQLVNGSFENGFIGWTLGGVSDDGYPPVVIDYNSSASYPTGAFGEPVAPDDAATPSPDPAGSHGAYFVADQAHPQTLSQFVNIVAGRTYTFGFDVYVPFNGAGNANDASFSAVVGGYNFATFTASSLTPGAWLHYDAIGTAAITGNVTFDFAYNSFGIPAKDFVIDRVYFGAVPETASWAMMLGGFGMIGGAMRARRKAVVSFG
jgi:hypothetical protein